MTTPRQILLVDDSAGDANLTMTALRSGSVASDVHHVTDGGAAIDYVRQTGPYQHAARPDLILLDLDLPVLNGHGVLATLKQDPALSAIPVVMLSTSTLDSDVRTAYALHANSYISKPVDFDDFEHAVRDIEQFWLVTAVLPPG